MSAGAFLAVVSPLQVGAVPSDLEPDAPSVFGMWTDQDAVVLASGEQGVEDAGRDRGDVGGKAQGQIGRGLLFFRTGGPQSLDIGTPGTDEETDVGFFAAAAS